MTVVNDLNLSAPTDSGASVSHVDALPVGSRLGEFEILGLLGVGGFGMVYRAFDHSLQRMVAIKEYMPVALAGRAPDVSVSIRSAVDQPSFSAGLNSFVAEARLLARFDHPALVKVFRFWDANGTAYMAMPLYAGMSLKEARAQMRSPPPELWLRKLLWSMLEALSVLHESNTLHRDVSPDNIFLQDVGPPVLLDLGSARRAVLEAGQKQTAILKVNYAPIEQYAQTVDLVQGPWTDLYSLAAVIHGCLCNELPAPATFRVVRDQMPKIAQVAATVQAHFGKAYSAEFAAAIDQALAVQPGDRPQSIAAFIAQMQLAPPADMARFDWRAELGDGVFSPVDAGTPEDATQVTQRVEPTLWTTVDDKTNPDGVTVDLAIEPPPAGARRVVAVAALLATLIGGGFLLNSLLAPAPKAVVMRATSVPSAAPSIVPEYIESQPVIAGMPPVVAQLPMTAPSRPARTSVPKPGQALAPAPKVPVVLCADSNFITRPMCVHLECQKPQFAGLAVCVEDRARYSESTDRSRP